MTHGEPKYAFLDIETTGLDPTFDVILEIGMILTDVDLNELATIGRTINWPEIEYNQLNGEYTPPFGVEKVVVDMHEKSGLWHDSYRSNVTLNAALSDITYWLSMHITEDKPSNTMPLVGNNVSFDRMFIQLQDPIFINLFDYHNFDMSSIKIAYNDWSSKSQLLPVGNKLHRSIPDCLDSINEARFFKKLFENI